MATSPDYIEFVAEQVRDFGAVRYKKMFGEYMVYKKPPFNLPCKPYSYDGVNLSH